MEATKDKGKKETRESRGKIRAMTVLFVLCSIILLWGFYDSVQQQKAILDKYTNQFTGDRISSDILSLEDVETLNEIAVRWGWIQWTVGMFWVYLIYKIMPKNEKLAGFAKKFLAKQKSLNRA